MAEMENWRLSRIEEELEKLDFTQEFLDQSFSDSIFNSLPTDIGQSLKDTAAHQSKANTKQADEGYSEDDDLPPPPEELLYPECTDPGGTNHLSDPKSSAVTKSEEIYSEAVINAESKDAREKRASEAIKHITDKYDSLKRLTLPSLPKMIPPGYINTKSPTKSPAKKLESPLNSVEFTFASAEPSPTNITKPDSCPNFGQSDSSWSDMDGPGRVAAFGEQQVLTNNSIRRTSFISSLSEHEILQVEMFYRSHKTEVFVCSCTADLYFGSVKDRSSENNFYNADSNSSGWTLIKPGIPALVLDTGDSHRSRKLSLVLAERGTGFTLWRETISYLTNYTAVQPNFHTLHLSNDNTKLVGLSFQDASGASDFIQKLKSITSNSDDTILSLSGKGKKKKDSKNRSKSMKSKKKPTIKGDISAPCCFTHITTLDRADGMGVLETTGNNDDNPSANVNSIQTK